MSDQVATATITGYTKAYVYLECKEIWPTKSLTLPREWLKHGYASEKRVLVTADPASIYHDGHGFVADIEIVGHVGKELLDSQ